MTFQDKLRVLCPDRSCLRTVPLNLALSRIGQGEAAGVQALLTESLTQCAALHDWAALGSGILALMGIAWTTLPLFMLDGCA